MYTITDIAVQLLKSKIVIQYLVLLINITINDDHCVKSIKVHRYTDKEISISKYIYKIIHPHVCFALMFYQILVVANYTHNHDSYIMSCM